MKRTTMLVIILMLFICYSSCHNDYRKLPEPQSGTGFEGLIQYLDWNSEFLTGSDGSDRLISLYGTGYSNVPELGYLKIENSHVTIYDKNEDLIFIKKGKFRISGAGKIAIYGFYNGTGFYDSNRFSAKLEFTILGGEVMFKGATGNFVGKLESSPGYQETLLLDFNGRIFGMDIYN